jgi:hypothetical protein
MSPVIHARYYSLSFTKRLHGDLSINEYALMRKKVTTKKTAKANHGLMVAGLIISKGTTTMRTI